MSGCKVGFVWSPQYESFDFGTTHPVRRGRFQSVRDFLLEHGLLDGDQVVMVNALPLPDDLLTATHSEEYIESVRMISQTGLGDIEIDTPGFRGILDTARMTCGGTITGVESVIAGVLDHFFSPTGGFHHARRTGGGGFCVFNDVAAAAILLKRRGFSRILIADFDVHHGNGTQEYFYHDPDVMQISFHEDPEWMYPHTGLIEEIGSGRGEGYTINMHFPMDSGDSVYQYAFDQIVPPIVEWYRPEFILLLPGFDAHYRDRLAHLKLTTATIRHIAEYCHEAAHRWSRGRIGVLSGGGYSEVARLWGSAVVMSVLSGRPFVVPSHENTWQDDAETWAEV
ncbi:MAG: hypothetical protein QXQ81_09325, partial [Candidatus Thorarchaeota archaeon]